MRSIATLRQQTIAASMLYIPDFYFVVIFLVLLAADEIGLVVHRSHFSEYGKAKDLTAQNYMFYTYTNSRTHS